MNSSVIDIAPSQGDERRQLRDALGRFATGVAIVSTRTPDGKCEGMTVNSFSALSLDPPMVLWSLRREAASFDSFACSDTFAVSILAADQSHLSQHFARPAADKFAGIEHGIGVGDCPLIEGAIATFECRVAERIMMGDHMLFIGAVERHRLADGMPLIFSEGRYWQRTALNLPDRLPVAATGY